MGACTFTRALGTSGVLPAGDQFDGTYNQYRVVRGLVTFSASYATGGDTLPMASIGLTEVAAVLVDPRLGVNNSGLSVAAVVTTPSAPKLQAFETNATEVANATNLSARTPTPVWILGNG